MINCDFEKVKEKWREYWAKENHDRPLICVTAPQKQAKGAKAPLAPVDIRERWLDMDYVIALNRYYMQNTVYLGESFPTFYCNLGPDIIGAVCGCDLQFGESTSWAKHFVEDWDSVKDIQFDETCFWWKKIEEMTDQACLDAKNDYVVGITDLHPGSDALVSLRGPQELCLDTIECPEKLKTVSKQVYDVYKIVYNKLYEKISALGNGTSYWMGQWSDRRHYVVGSDFSCMLSGEMYEDLIVPDIEREIDFLDQSIYHLDGPQALRHLDRILQFEKLNAVQWVYGAGQPSAKHWVEVLKKIQKAGKCIDISGPAEDLPELMKYLNSEGFVYHCVCNSKEEAESLLKMFVK